MKTSYSNTIINKFYQKVGILFYAVAIVDGSIHTKEIDKLKILIREKWLPLNDVEDEYGTDAAFQIEIVFNWLLENEKLGNDCFEEFKSFYHKHKSVFSKEIKALILETANAIAYSFSGRNKAELIILAKLQLLFHSKETN